MQIQENVSLAPYTTLRIGGPARWFAQVTTEDELLEAVTFARTRALPLFPLGGGSNLLVADAGYPGLVLQLTRTQPMHIEGLTDAEPQRRTITYDVPAGMDWNRFVRTTVDARFTGVECLAGIPGNVGAAPVQNIGAYGQEVSQTITSVRVLDLETLTFRHLTAAECGFAYRTSIFNSTQRGRFFITSVRFSFSLDDEPKLKYADLLRYFEHRKPPTPLQIYRAVRRIRRSKGMLLLPDDATHPARGDFRSAGSFFKNPIVPLATLDRIASHLGIRVEEIQHWPIAAHPEAADPGGTVPQQGSAAASKPASTKLPAAWLIERAGFAKGYTLGPVGISTRHTLALTNRTGTATCADLFVLRDQIIAGVHNAFGIILEQEPVYLC